MRCQSHWYLYIRSSMRSIFPACFWNHDTLFKTMYIGDPFSAVSKARSSVLSPLLALLSGDLAGFNTSLRGPCAFARWTSKCSGGIGVQKRPSTIEDCGATGATGMSNLYVLFWTNGLQQRGERGKIEWRDFFWRRYPFNQKSSWSLMKDAGRWRLAGFLEAFWIQQPEWQLSMTGRWPLEFVLFAHHHSEVPDSFCTACGAPLNLKSFKIAIATDSMWF